MDQRFRRLVQHFQIMAHINDLHAHKLQEGQTLHVTFSARRVNTSLHNKGCSKHRSISGSIGYDRNGMKNRLAAVIQLMYGLVC